MAQIKVQMIKSKETPGAVVFQEVDEGGRPVDQKVGKLNTTYVRKLAFEGGIPNRITVTIDY